MGNLPVHNEYLPDYFKGFCFFSSYHQSVVVDLLFNVPPICVFIFILWFLLFHVLLCALPSFAIMEMELPALLSFPPDV